jgi:hypothetical protein
LNIPVEAGHDISTVSQANSLSSALVFLSRIFVP